MNGIKEGYNKYPRDAWLEVDLTQFKKNLDIIRKTAGVPTLVVVKANAYGHGIVPIAEACEEQNVRMLGVATLGEAMLIKEAGVRTDLLRITGYGASEIDYMVKEEIHFFAWREDHIRAASQAAEKYGVCAHVHLKIDTGFGRAGVFAEDALPVARLAHEDKNIELVGICSHFHTADGEDTGSVQAQLQKFNQAIEAVEGAGIDVPLIHIANSPGLLRFPEARFTMVRAGVVTYGMPYEEGFPVPDGVSEIAQWKARVVNVKTLPPGHSVGYGGEYVTKGEEVIAILPIGYADGLHRFPKNVNEVLIQGRVLKTIGRICMDQCMVSIPSDMTVQEGEEAVFVGEQKGAKITAIDVGNRWGTNNYDVLANISPRVPRVYV